MNEDKITFKVCCESFLDVGLTISVWEGLNYLHRHIDLGFKWLP